MLVDVRETASIRGFHALAAARLVLETMPGTTMVALTNGTADERLALQVLAHDVGSSIAAWVPSEALAAYLPVPLRRRRRFAVCLEVLSDRRLGWRGRLARRVAGVTVVGRMGRAAASQARAIVVNGHDTRAVADAVVAALRRVGSS